MRELAVAIAWNQSHFLGLGGFHPLYSGLLEAAPASVKINAWDNVALHRQLECSDKLRQEVLSGLHEQVEPLDVPSELGFGAEARQLARLLPGDIELFHSLPFATQSRPFVLHLESLRSLFTPWLALSTAIEEQLPLIRAYYRDLLTGPLCLGVFSHQPSVLAALREFIAAPQLESRLFSSGIGLPAWRYRDGNGLPDKPSLASPAFVFVAGADPDADFFTRGGHRVLAFWQAFLAAGHRGTLCLMGERPSPAALQAAGVDKAFLAQHDGRSLFWTSASSAEVEAVMAGSHFLLLPADVLCSYEILRAMSLGCVPVIAAVQGSDVLFQDNRNGVTLGTEPPAGAPWEIPRRTAQDDALLVQELLQRLPQILTPVRYGALQQAGYQRGEAGGSAEAVATSFWQQVRQLFSDYRPAARPASAKLANALAHCLLDAKGRRRAFASQARPRLRINTGLGSVWSLGADFVRLDGCPSLAPYEWSVLAPYREAGKVMVWANRLPELRGEYLPKGEAFEQRESLRVVRTFSRLLMRFPRLHSLGSYWLRQCRRAPGALAHAATRIASVVLPQAESSSRHVHLVVDGFHGFNIIFYDGLFHAVLQSDGTLTPRRMEKGLYNHFYSDPDLEAVKQSVVVGLAEMRSTLAPGLSIPQGMK